MHLKYCVPGYLFRFWVKGVLDVALSYDAEVPDDFDSSVPQHVVLVVVERLTGRHNDGFSSMDAQRVNILHITHLNNNKWTLKHTNEYRQMLHEISRFMYKTLFRSSVILRFYIFVIGSGFIT